MKDTAEAAEDVSIGPRGRAGSKILRALGYSVLGLALLVAGAVALLNTSIGKRFIADQIAAVAPVSGLRFEVGRIEGNVFDDALMHDVVLLDPKGEFLRFSKVQLEWRPLAWIWSGLDVEELVASGGTLRRLPELLPGDPDAPILPDFDIRIGNFEIDGLTIAPGIVGETSPVINFKAQADIRDGRVFVKADSELGKSDTFALLIDAEPDDDRFDATLDYDGPKGGVLAGLLGADTGYLARVTGDGSWQTWNGSLFAKRDDERVAAFKLTNRAGQFGMLGRAYPLDLLQGITARLAGPSIAILARGTLEQSVFDGRVTLVGERIGGTGQGAVDLANNAFDDFAVSAKLTDPEAFSTGLRLDGARMTANLDGAFRDLSIDHELIVDRLNTGAARLTSLTQSGTAEFDGARWTLPLAVTVATVETGTGFVDSKLTDGTLEGTVFYIGSKLISDDLQLLFPTAKAEVALRGDLAAGTYQFTGPVDVRGLTLENLGDVSGGGKIDLQVRDTGAWALKTSFDARIPNVTNATLANIAGTSIRASGAVSVGSAIALDFRNVAVRAQKLTLDMNGTIQQGTTSFAGRGSHTDYGPFTVEAAVNDSGPTATLVFASPLPAAGLKDVRVALSPTPEGFNISTAGQSLLGEFSGEFGLYAPENGPARLDIQKLLVWKTVIAGGLTLEEGGARGAMRLSGGGLDGTIGLATRDGGQGFAFDIAANRAQFGGVTPISIARADIEGSGYLKDGRNTVEASILAEGLSYGSLFIGRLAATSELQNGAGIVTASLAGRRGGQFNLQLNADIAPQRIAIASRGEFAGKRIRMPRRAVFDRQDDGGWQLARTLLQYGEGGVVASGELGGGRSAINLSLDRMPLSLVDLALTDFGLGGTVSGKVDFASNGSGKPVGSAQVAIRNLTRSGLVLSSQPIDVSLVADLSGSALDTRALIKEGGQRNGRLQARISNLSPAGGLIERLRQGNLKAQLRYGGPASALWRLLAIEAFDLTGPIAVAANVTGTLADPAVRGSISSDNLRMRSGLSGTDIRAMTVRGSFAGSRLRLTRFTGKTDNGGTVSGSGVVDLQDIGPKGPSLDIKVAANKARLLNAGGLDATITGPLRIVSSGRGGTIAGRVKIIEASWTLGTADAALALPQIRTREINIPADIAPARERFVPWTYLIDAEANNRVNVDGLGLDSEWRADIILRGTTADPRIGGSAQVVRGFYSFAGTRFELTRGRINFDANVPIDPRLDILAETERDGLDVAVSVRGNAQTPEITFSSTPLLPEEEILSRLLFGGSITELSATDALQLGTALASLQGGSGLDPINQLRSAIGLDRLRIVSADPALNRGTGVALGKNIGRRFYAEIITDGRGYSATRAEFRISSWLSLLASVSTIGRESVVAEISKDY